MKKIPEAFQRFRVFVTRDLWDTELASVSFVKRQVIKLLRILHLIFKGFREDELPLRASGLTFVTLLSLGPLLAFIFAIFKGLYGETKYQQIEADITKSLQDMPEEVSSFVLEMIRNVMSSSAGGIGGFALVILVYTVIKVMGNIEHSFNRVFGVTSSRTFLRKVTDYVSTLLLVPVCVVASGAAAGFRTTAFWQNQSQAVHDAYGYLVVLVPLFVAWVAFSILYIIMPNTRVKFTSAFAGGLGAALIFLVWQKFYVLTQSWLFAGEAKDIVFGAFAAVPIFMFWLYVCWIIVLFGAEVAFAIQNSTTYAREQRAGDASEKSRQMLGVALATEMTRCMTNGQDAFHAGDFSKARGVPIRLINEVLEILIQANIVGSLTDQGGRYVLLKTPEQITVKEIIDVIENHGTPPRSLGVEQLDAKLREFWSVVDIGVGNLMREQTLRRLADQDLEPGHLQEAGNGRDPVSDRTE